MIIITGASRGVGKFLFDKYSETEKVIGTYLTTISEKEKDNMFQLDISNFEQVVAFIQKIKDGLNNITLINCAGISYNSFAHKSDTNLWVNVINTNLIGTFFMIRSLLPIMREQKFGRIVNFSSVTAQKSTPGISAYSASKSALWGMSKSIAVENAALGITINNINLGYSELGMIEQVSDLYKESILQQIPSKMLCSKEDVYSTVEYIRKTEYLNGISIDLSGGLV